MAEYREAYRSGDHVYRDREGRLTFVGRKDDQWQLRGRRMHPLEVEAALCELSGVAAAAVRIDPRDTGGLVAHVVMQPGHPPLRDWRRSLATRLAPGLLPRQLVVVDNLPRTRNGKLDRQALSIPSAPTNDETRPPSAFESVIADHWRAILDTQPRAPIAPTSSFFDVGGDSLRAAALAARLSAAFARTVGIRDLVRHSTLESLAAWLSCAPTPEIRPGPTTRRRSPPRSHQEAQPACPYVGSVVDAATLSYLPDTMASRPDRDDHRRHWLGGRTRTSAILDTKLGRTAILTMPLFHDELWTRPEDLQRHVQEAVHLADGLGVRAIALAGLVPSVLSLHHRVRTQLADDPRVTTGHATTASAVVMSLDRALAAFETSLESRRIAILGAGSVGLAVARLLVHRARRPAGLLLADLDARGPALRAESRRIEAKSGVSTEWVTSEHHAANAVYEADTIVGATNMPDVLDPYRLRSGTIVVDDSSPSCFDEVAARTRMRTRRDVLVSHGGCLRPPRATVVRHRLVAVAPAKAGSWCSPALADSWRLPSCVAGGLLAAADPRFRTGLRPASATELAANWTRLRREGFSAPPPGLEDVLFLERDGASEVSHVDA